jgi:hypothetical protein
MKTMKITVKKVMSLTLAALMAIAVLAACKKSSSPLPEIAAVSIYNAIPDAGALDFYISDKKVNKDGLSFGAKLDYFEAYLGKRPVKISLNSDGSTLMTKEINLEESAYYSAFLIDKKQSADILLLKDNFLNKNNDKAQIRFVNLSPDTTSLSLEIQGDTTSFTNRIFKAASAFKYVAGKSNATFLLKKKATGQVLVTVTDVEIKNGFLYTIWSKGLPITSDADQKLSLKVSSH